MTFPIYIYMENHKIPWFQTTNQIDTWSSQNPVGDMPRGPRPVLPNFTPWHRLNGVAQRFLGEAATTQRLGIWLKKGISALGTWILLSWLLKHHFFGLVEPACLFLNHAKSIFVLVKCWFNNYSIPHCLLVTYHMANSLIFTDQILSSSIIQSFVGDITKQLGGWDSIRHFPAWSYLHVCWHHLLVVDQIHNQSFAIPSSCL